MIVKPYTQTLYMEALISLNKRLHKSHPKYLSLREELHRNIAGNIGEEAVMNFLEKVNLPYKFYAFHNISLYGESLIQMDILLISQYYAVILEVKNIQGEIEFKSHPFQLSRTLATGERHSFESPEIQLQEYIYQLNGIFKETGISIPIYGAVVFPFTSSYMKTPPGKTTILFRNEIRFYLRNLGTQNPPLSLEDLNNLKNFILNKTIIYNPFPLTQRYLIHPNDIIIGVECTSCNFAGMKKVARHWICPRCKNVSNDAHDQTIKDYFLVYKNSISNKECRHFLKLNNIHEATRILKNANLIKTGKYKDASYKMHFTH
ncbi:nuclease-related domain-containing protein [Psychrobacillus sp. NPDC096623]|uniref:nuclease-related domain-containing protein n=1 Tax=Psychrobacillus sp. NPDC096623 TaxID=3364492 RepID=UPI003827DF55